jgi:hypothetical protein
VTFRPAKFPGALQQCQSASHFGLMPFQQGSSVMRFL